MTDMANSSSDSVYRQVQRLFNLGRVGSLTDAQLLDWFVSQRDEAREAAFEELMIRHGPMVFRVCRSVLQDAHDAEDAFQAAFLVLAHRARSIRRRESVASWLFGVAHRVASRARSRAARSRALDERMASRTSEGYLPADECLDWAVLHEEIDRLPDRLRAPLVLCYLEGLTYEAAAHQLGLSDGVLRGRLSRARERLRIRLVRRGMTVPAGLLVAGAAGQAQAAIPLTLIQGTIRIALGFMAGNTAAVLARGVLNSMLMNQLKVVAVLLLVGIGSSYWVWRAFAAASDDKGQANSRQVAGKTPAPAPKSRATPPAVTYRLTGSVRVEGTGEPVKGAQLDVQLGDLVSSNDPGRIRTVTSGSDGQFRADLPGGQAFLATIQPPVGYWAPNNMIGQETFVVSPTQPIYRKDFVVRRGTVWPFRLTIGADKRPVRVGTVVASNPSPLVQNQVDDSGLANVTLPTEVGSATAWASTDHRWLRRFFPAVPIAIPLEWAANFRPEAVKKVEPLDGRFRLTDDAGRIATIGVSGRAELNKAGQVVTIPESGRVQPIATDGKLVIGVNLPEPESVMIGSLSGQVVDEKSRPIQGALVSLAFHIHEGNQGGGVFPDDRENQATTDQNGKFLIHAVRCQVINEKPTSLSLVVRKEGFASLETPEFSFQPGKGDSSHVLDPIRLGPGVSLSGTVVGPDGRPVEGVWVKPTGSFALGGQFTRTDAAGRFTVRNLPKDIVKVSFQYGQLWALGGYLADGVADQIKVQLSPIDAAPVPATTARPAVPQPPALGQPAPPLQVVGWTDGKSHSLADYRGKVVFLEFWGIWCIPCINGMPSLERLKQKYEPRGVIFLSIHTPGEAIGKIRRFLDLKKATFLAALDQGQGVDDKSRNGPTRNGTTANQYGVKGYPTLVMIDRKGNVAFHSGIGTKGGVEAMKAQGKEMGLDESAMTEKDFYRLWEAFFGRAIDNVLQRP
jgi:RNA polymerase sigma factor (sigma-70 family)